ncbi:rRNA pseudouridine synthase [Candidatus Parcubacteria bacterium]|nr:MAG: rRNA pseudouridine synthase [Candidatus Parcubacteria bacterium]
MPENKKIRLAKFLAQSGVASRRKAEELIISGKVKVAGKIVKEPATTIDPSSLEIRVNNQPIILEEKVYYLLNKPVGYLSSVSDPHHDKTVLDLVPQEPRVFPVGRLDKDSQGLMILTNDGDLAYQLTHPKFEVKKIYRVKVDKRITADLAKKLLSGVSLTEGRAKADKVLIKSVYELEIVIHQGWKRQIRRMLESLGYQVLLLERIAEGKVKLGKLALGKYKRLSLKDLL